MKAPRAIAIVRVMQEDREADADGLAGEESEALSVVLELAEAADGRLPRLLAPGEEIPPGCTAEMRAALTAGPAATVAVVDEARGRTYHLPAAPSRAFAPHGRTSAEIATAAGDAARELVAEHEPGAGAVVEVRLVRRGGQLQSVGQDVRDCACLNPLRGALPTSGACFNCGGHVSAKRVAQMGEP